MLRLQGGSHYSPVSNDGKAEQPMFSRTEAKYIVEATNAANKMVKLGRN